MSISQGLEQSFDGEGAKGREELTIVRRYGITLLHSAMQRAKILEGGGKASFPGSAKGERKGQIARALARMDSLVAPQREEEVQRKEKADPSGGYVLGRGELAGRIKKKARGTRSAKGEEG